MFGCSWVLSRSIDGINSGDGIGLAGGILFDGIGIWELAVDMLWIGGRRGAGRWSRRGCRGVGWFGIGIWFRLWALSAFLAMVI